MKRPILFLTLFLASTAISAQERTPIVTDTVFARNGDAYIGYIKSQDGEHYVIQCSKIRHARRKNSTVATKSLFVRTDSTVVLGWEDIDYVTKIEIPGINDFIKLDSIYTGRWLKQDTDGTFVFRRMGSQPDTLNIDDLVAHGIISTGFPSDSKYFDYVRNLPLIDRVIVQNDTIDGVLYKTDYQKDLDYIQTRDSVRTVSRTDVFEYQKIIPDRKRFLFNGEDKTEYLSVPINAAEGLRIGNSKSIAVQNDEEYYIQIDGFDDFVFEELVLYQVEKWTIGQKLSGKEYLELVDGRIYFRPKGLSGLYWLSMGNGESELGVPVYFTN